MAGPNRCRMIGRILGRMMPGLIIPASLVFLGLLWWRTPLRDFLDPNQLAELTHAVSRHPLSPLFILTAYLIGGVILFPVSVLIMATAVLFSPWVSFGYAMAGCMVSACCSYVLGRRFGWPLLQTLTGDRFGSLRKRFVDRGLLPIFSLRLMPVAPFALKNLLVGTLGFNFRDFFLGTALSILPGVLALTLLASRLQLALATGRFQYLLPGMILLAVLCLVSFLLRSRFKHMVHGSDPGAKDP